MTVDATCLVVTLPPNHQVTSKTTKKSYSLSRAQVSTPRGRLLHDIHKVEQEALVAHAESPCQDTDGCIQACF